MVCVLVLGSGGLGPRGLGLFLFRSCSGPSPFLFWSCSVLVVFRSCSGSGPVRGSIRGSGGSVRVPWGSGSGPVLGPDRGSVLGPVDIFEFLLRKKGWVVLI